MTREGRYDPEPRYRAVGGHVEDGLPPLLDALIRRARDAYRVRGRGKAVKAFVR